MKVDTSITARNAANVSAGEMVMKSERVEVECYSGGRADERPRSVMIGGSRHTVARLLSESIEESAEKRDRTHRYRILTDDGLVVELVRTADRRWFLSNA